LLFFKIPFSLVQSVAYCFCNAINDESTHSQYEKEEEQQSQLEHAPTHFTHGRILQRRISLFQVLKRLEISRAMHVRSAVSLHVAFEWTFNGVYRGGVGCLTQNPHTLLSTLLLTNQTSDTPFKSHQPLLPRTKKEEKTQPKIQPIYKGGLLTPKATKPPKIYDDTGL
jgi:hypothetical protein